ncbi:MAG TPA: Ppx/GppA phosphatase family protein [Casimicrobiaceae bacterium]|nr:Ppx/GppA phosphatase family protein [Casimicrobiaceae bacterium]
MPATTLAVVDLGSNSFRLEIGRVEGDQIYRLDTWRETLRFGAGLDAQGRIRPAAQRAALECLARFRERLTGLHPSAVRAVATNTFRVAKNAREFLAVAERALGFPIDVIGGHEEARLIYLGVAHELPRSIAPRLVVDIGGGSTEFIIGRGLEPERLESLKIGCVGMTQRYFPQGRLTEEAFAAAETAARVEIEAIARQFGPSHWREAYASSGTAAALAEILEQNGFSGGGITPAGLARLRKRMIAARHIARVSLRALKIERAPVLAGGLAIMTVAVDELRIERVDPVGGALRLGVLYDLLGRTIDADVRGMTVQRFVDRYAVDRAHATRVAALAVALYRRALPNDREGAQLIEWAARLHEIGMSVSHIGFHKHGAYILQHGDMPGFSAGEQSSLAWLVFGCRGGLAKMQPGLGDPTRRAQLLVLRLAVIFHHARAAIKLTRIQLRVARRIALGVSPRWLAAHPLTAHLLAKERGEWGELGYRWKTLRD